MQFIDQLQRTIEIAFPPQRIISLVPSQTELLFDLGLETQIIGVTKFCVHPAQIRRSREVVGGTKQLQLEKIASLHPDLIIANKEENEKDQIAVLEKQFPVWISDVKTFADAMAMITGIGNITGASVKAASLVKQINSMKDMIHSKPIRAVYLIWKDPYMTVGSDTFIHAMMDRAGFKNVFEHALRYPECSIQQMMDAKPAIIFLASEPFPFLQKHADEIKEYLPAAKILLVDGEMFSWCGSRLLHSFPYFAELWEHLQK